MSKLHFKYGAMNSGKSDSLIKTAYNYIEQGHDVLTIKPSVDTKGERTILARGGASRNVDILATPDLDLQQAIHAQQTEKLACILVDEAQFLTSEQIDQLFRVAKFDDISVIAYGLRTDFQTKQFPGTIRLFELADAIEKLPTMCRCGNQAEFNCRKVGDRYVFQGDQVAIDGQATVSYDSLCGICYFTEKANSQTETTTAK